MPALERGLAAVLGEFGGLGLPTRGHTWQGEKNWGYISFKDTAEYEAAYREKIAQLRLLVARGLSAAIYTQTTDVETEVNGLMTYDREVVKIPQPALAEISKSLSVNLPSVATMLPASEMDGRAWRYVTGQPADAWASPGFDDSAWQSGLAPFGGGKPEGVPVRTPWTTPQIWMRQGFEWKGAATAGLHLLVAHDDAATIFVNGVEAASVKGHTTGYVIVPVSEEAARALRLGTNVIAVRCAQEKGAQAIDVGLLRIIQ
jgi:hypothetical protein